MPEKISYLILDYQKPEESKVCLESIHKNSKFDYQVIYLSNGGEQDYVLDYYKAGLIDKLILNKKNSGSGCATVDLYNICDTNYAFYVQNDQELIAEIRSQDVEFMIDMLRHEYSCIDLAGAQAGINRFSERVSLMNVKFYNQIPKLSVGGPGPLNFCKYLEQVVQEYFAENNLKIMHCQPAFKDNGKWSIREIGDGIYKHRCDTKVLQVLKRPTYKTEVYPPFTDQEWQIVLNGGWPTEGQIPENWKQHSFVAWND